MLVLLDEFQNLGKLENALTVATGLGAYGVPCWFFVQSLRSIDNVYTREGRQTLVNSARAQIFLGAEDPEDQRYVSQLLGERKDVMVDKAVSTGVTLFDRKSATMSHKTTMRPLMRPDELGSMNEARCIIKLRNQQPIVGVRNFYYADKELLKRAWLPMRAPKNQTTADDAAGFTIDSAQDILAFDPPLRYARPGRKFAVKSLAVAKSRLHGTKPEKIHLSPDAPHGAQRADGRNDANSLGGAPDFKSALNKSAARKAEADKSLQRILTIFESAPVKKRAAKKAEKEIGLVFSDK